MTVGAIVEAATRILAREGAAALSTNRIAEVAGVSVGSVYQYFPDKGAIVAALVEKQVARVRKVFEDLPPVDEKATVADLVGECVAIVFRAALDTAEFPPGIEEFGPPPMATRVRADETIRDRFRRILEARRDELVVADIDLAASFCTAAVRGVLRIARENRVAAPFDAMMAETTDLLVRYLIGRT